MTKEHNNSLKTLLNVGSTAMIMLTIMLKYELIVESLENIETLHKEITISTFN